MKALVSGQAGVAILIEKKRIFSLHIGEENTIPRTKEDIPYLLADTTDVIELDKATPETARTSLELAYQKDRALHLILILLDGDADSETRTMAAECLEEFFAESEAFDFVRNRLYVAPLPQNVDFIGAVLQAEEARASHLVEFLHDLDSHQSDIHHCRETWEALPNELFGDSVAKQQFGYAAVTAGLFRSLAQVSSDEADQVLFEYLRDPQLRQIQNSRKILMDWLQPFRETQRTVVQPVESEDDHERFSEGGEVVSQKSKRSHRVHESIKKQKETIKNLLSEGAFDRAFRYVNGLVRYQSDRSELNELAKSLCDLAQHAKSLGAHEIQLQLSQQAVETLPSDGWSQAQLGDAYRCLNQYEDALKAYNLAANYGQLDVAGTGRAEILKELGHLEEARVAYEETVQAFPHNVVARNGQAEILKELGHLEEARVAYEETVQAFPHDVVARTGQAEILKELGHLEEARVAYEETVQAFPHEILKELGHLEEARVAYEETVQAFPHDVVARTGQAEILKELGHLEEARVAYEETVQAFPHDVVARTNWDT